MCKAFGVPYAYPLPLSYTEDLPDDEEECIEKDKNLIVIDFEPYDDAYRDYLETYPVLENEKRS